MASLSLTTATVAILSWEDVGVKRGLMPSPPRPDQTELDQTRLVQTKTKPDRTRPRAPCPMEALTDPGPGSRSGPTERLGAETNTHTPRGYQTRV